MLDDGLLGLRASKALIVRYIDRVNNQAESIKSNQEAKEALDQQLHRLKEQVTTVNGLLSKNQIELTKAWNDLSEEQNAALQNQQNYDSLSTQFTAAQGQRNFFMCAFIACALGFIGYILRAKYAVIA